MKKTMEYLHQKKRDGRKITMLTCYDYPTAQLQDEAGIDVIFAGDSVGTNQLGYKRETSVTLDDIIHHLKAVRRGVEHAYLLADMPYRTYENADTALATAQMLLRNGADGVKLEGLHEEIVAHLYNQGIEVWGHLGFNPQYHEKAAVQGKTYDSARVLAESVRSLQAAGACMVVLELIPEELGKIITEQVTIPTIGIGAGRFTDGQVLIVHDMLGITPRELRHSKNYGHVGEIMLKSFQEYASEVEAGAFPNVSNVRHMKAEELSQLMRHYGIE
ncbi:3-methyl-2-oxobutanoate hydroxymethyltransferase [Paenibacillus konkukensis]|uniref:3-methyl-2-oxobutanoate hydroxymethyltransferase n=1 Tax=Paenibacillus konkukensis TaxID=2020716 RepID=A0ABY4RSQ1_9BACL|nr:3-methyl-2-oxobutanoate hydroxymethyltransferase [Paenibacillus konkukensis]UQZ85467.1 3-methyl-2-oxobutanoate hydroxymethyltransferase [Paenibacillus konkukensis]